MMARLKAWWVEAKLYEPARLAAAWSSVRALAAVLFITIPTGADLWVDVLAGFLAVLLPMWQGERTRAQVVAETKHDEDVVVALNTDPPGRHASEF